MDQHAQGSPEEDVPCPSETHTSSQNPEMVWELVALEAAPALINQQY